MRVLLLGLVDDAHPSLTDPTLADTDGDGLTDDVDPAPTFAARILHVDDDSSGGNGLTWGTAKPTLEGAINRAVFLNGDQNPTNDISEIWVAQGVYTPPAGQSFRPPAGVSIYGGFEGGELKRAQRTADGRFNGTILTPSDQSVLISSVPRGATVDGFTLDAAGIQNVSATLSLNSSGTYRNLFITGFFNTAFSGTLGTVMLVGSGARDVFEDCTFADNDARIAAGRSSTIMVLSGAAPTFTGCTFSGNTTTTFASTFPASGGALFADSASNPTLLQCRFLNNVADAQGLLAAFGGAVFLTRGTIVGCEFRGNGVTARLPLREIWSSFRSGGALAVAGECTILNSVFFGNQCPSFGGAVFVLDTGDARMINCSFSGNRVSSSNGQAELTLDICSVSNCGDDAVWDVQALAVGVEGNLEAENCIFWSNTSATPLIRLNGSRDGRLDTNDFEIGLGQESQISTRPHYRESAFARMALTYAATSFSSKALRSTARGCRIKG